MFSLLHLLNLPYGYYNYFWIDVRLIKETQKAILVEFDGRKNWFPKAWIVRIKRGKDDNTIKIKISLYHWVKKF